MELPHFFRSEGTPNVTDISFLDRFVHDNCAMLRGHSRRALMAATESLMGGAQLTLSNLGRRLSGNSRTKHKIKRVDRLLGNERCMASAWTSIEPSPLGCWRIARRPL